MNKIGTTRFKFGGIYRDMEHDHKQAALTSFDFFLFFLNRLGVVSEPMASKAWQKLRIKIFYD